MKILGLIPARGGSKGLPGKNLRPLLGVPLIGRTILAALKSKALDRLIVSTDDPKIAACARAFGAEVPFLRPKRLATDQAAVVDAALHALDELAKSGDRPDAVMLLQPTSPLRTAATIRKAAALLKKTGEAVVSVAAASEHPLWARKIENGRLVPFLDKAPASRQQLPPAYALDGSIYLVPVSELRRRRRFAWPGARALVSPAAEVCDIDELDDFEAAERRLARGRRAPEPGRVFIVAEAGVNHNGRLSLAKKLVDAAKAAGADAVKFQTFKTEALVTAAAPLAAYQRQAGVGSAQAAMLRGLELSEADHRALRAHCRAAGVEFMSTPFDSASLALLERLGVKRHKIPSGEITNRGLIESVARTGKPLILSTGMSTLAEVGRALGWIRAISDAPVTVLHCVTEYPAPADSANLRALAAMAEAFGLPVGWSDHTSGIDIALASVALGATVLEKHLTLDRGLPGPDHAASLEPAEFKALVAAVRRVESALGDGIKRPQPCEMKNIKVARRGLVAARDLQKGTVLGHDDLAAKRPAIGIEPGDLALVVGRRLRRGLKRDQALTWEAL